MSKSGRDGLASLKWVLGSAFEKLKSISFWFWFSAVSYGVIVAINLSENILSKRDWWENFYTISNGFLTGALVSFFFYFIVVHLPEYRKQQIIKSNFKKLYREIKEDILVQVIFASQNGGRKDLRADTGTIKRLLTIEGFRGAFQRGREGNEGFYAFRNRIGEDVPEYREIILHLRMLARQTEFLLHKYPITDERIFGFFKRLEIFLLEIEARGPGYTEEKQLSKFIWEIFAGQNPVDGDLGYDIVERMIDGI